MRYVRWSWIGSCTAAFSLAAVLATGKAARAGDTVIQGFQLSTCTFDGQHCVRIKADRAFHGKFSPITVFDTAEVELVSEATTGTASPVMAGAAAKSTRKWRGTSGRYDPRSETVLLRGLEGSNARELVVVIRTGQTFYF